MPIGTNRSNGDAHRSVIDQDLHVIDIHVIDLHEIDLRAMDLRETALRETAPREGDRVRETSARGCFQTLRGVHERRRVGGPAVSILWRTAHLDSLPTSPHKSGNGDFRRAVVAQRIEHPVGRTIDISIPS